MRTITRLLLFFVLMMPLAVLAQADITVKGTVVDETNEPLTGVSVMVKGTTNGTVTNLDGEFTLKCPKGATIVLSYVSYADLEVIATETPMNLVMREDVTLLEGVVVTALGIQRKAASLTYATQEVKGEDLMRVQDANFVNA